MTGSAQEMLDALDALIRRSEYIAAFDLAQQGVAAHPDSVALRHRGVLSLARMGATARAAALFDSWGLHEVSDDEDVLALWARLKKDEAQALSGPAQVAALEDAAAAYARGFEAGDGGYYPAINVASLSLLAGQVDKAREWAARAQALAMGEDYWSLSTRAEAALVLNRPEDAASWIARAAAAAPDDHAARATSRAQMAQIIAHLDLDPSLLKPLTAPRVAHFCGHMVTGPGGRMPASEIARITEAVRTTIADDDIGFAVGSLAGGADIIIAEEILAAGAELSVVLPFDQAEFVDVSVRPSGSDWVARFDACLAAAHSVHFVTEEAYLGDSGLFAYASHFALGLARLRAQMLGAELIQLAVWDGAAPDPEAAAGTAHDLATGYRMGLAQRLVPSREGAVLDPRRFAGHVPPDMGNRRQRTMIFG
ncbi:MAG: tetratricopeptide repeat-containing protein, partial [Pseudomonadota bacterium]